MRALRALRRPWLVPTWLARKTRHGRDLVRRARLTSEPLNGQARRRELVLRVLEVLQPDAIVETGTFTGLTTEFLARFGSGRIYTVEVLRSMHLYAMARLLKYRNVHLFRGDSRAFLERLARDPSFPRRRVFFYLDAHGPNRNPLADELTTITSNWTDCVVLVDDFAVPGDAGYGFDVWSGAALSLEHNPLQRLEPFSLYFPAARSSEETGLRRGSALITDSDDVGAKLVELRVVRPFTGSPTDRT